MSNTFVYINVNGALPNSYKTFQIEGASYVIRTYWNRRAGGLLSDGSQMGAWQLDLYYDEFPEDPSDTSKLIIGGRQIEAFQSLFSDYLINPFEGIMLCMDTSPVKDDDIITLNNFGEGRRYQLVYVSPSTSDE